MKSKKHGENTVIVKIKNLKKDGFELVLKDESFFLDFKNYPWFKDKKAREIKNVVVVHGQVLSWPDIDVDLGINSLRHPENYPLIF